MCFRESVAYMGRCLRCTDRQRQEGVQDQDIIWETYQGETSRSVVSRAREHYADYKTAMKKPPPTSLGRQDRAGGRGHQTGSGQEEDEEEQGSSWMADHSRSHHAGRISADPREDYDFLVLDQWRKPLERQLEEAVRIKLARTRGFLMLGQGRKARKLKVNPILLNRKMENFSP